VADYTYSCFGFYTIEIKQQQISWDSFVISALMVCIEIKGY